MNIKRKKFNYKRVPRKNTEEQEKINIDRNSLCFLPLGGSGEFGLNMNLYHCNGKWIIVDLGITFDKVPGSDIMVPDISFIKSLDPQDVLGLIITHGHEDHIGAIPYLIDDLNIPVYATPFTSSLINNKLKEANSKGVLKTVDMGSTLNLGPFDIKWINVTHSIPESAMIYIKTPLGNIMHTGDWKFEDNPVIGIPTDYKSMESAAKDGILAAVCDSTNAMVDEETVTEKEVQNTIDQALSEAKSKDSRIVIGCFSSNVARVDSCARLAKKYGRSVVLVGRSIHRIKDAALKHGYFKDLPDFLTEDEGSRIDKSRVMFICTGSQGEMNSGLKRLSENNHPRIKVNKGDTVLISARTIIGKEKEVSQMLNNFAKIDVNIIKYTDSTPVHASGHPMQSDLVKFYKMLKPKISVPVHGEICHQKAHAKLVSNLNIKPFIVSNGDILVLSGKSVGVSQKMISSRMVVDGKALVPEFGSTIRQRYLLEDGCIFVTIFIDNKDYIRTSLSFYGICEKNDTLKDSIKETLKKDIIAMDSNDRKVYKVLTEKVKQSVHHAMFESRGKDPVVLVHLVTSNIPRKKKDSERENGSKEVVKNTVDIDSISLNKSLSSSETQSPERTIDENVDFMEGF
ncbi:ribonuclease J [Candidatus Nesciobacter abundans]|uniref:Ribonuclease J n=1 Tax=Candidatus Nesciobacter abundans TaxID=2601668 RepID=A0A5C0UGD7_9PROT|nr:ribonuclease J [Candidatus Nesciobacter abundans]QEK39176.1 ribonuclease J [Candidatus Nesciobacter abundans]